MTFASQAAVNNATRPVARVCHVTRLAQFSLQHGSTSSTGVPILLDKVAENVICDFNDKFDYFSVIFVRTEVT